MERLGRDEERDDVERDNGTAGLARDVGPVIRGITGAIQRMVNAL